MNGLVAMIPAQFGGSLVPNKDLRMLGGRPLIAHAIETALTSQVFSEVYVSSGAEVFRRVAECYGAKFYQCPQKFSAAEATNEQYVLDFVENVACDVLVQLDPATPFVESDDLKRAVDLFGSDAADTVLTLKEVKNEGYFKGQPINFDPAKEVLQPQDLESLFVLCNGILAWRGSTFKSNMREYGSAFYGGKGSTHYCLLDDTAAFHIDSEQDFRFAECILKSREHPLSDPKYWDATTGGGSEHVECDVPSILEKDGVDLNDLYDTNHALTDVGMLLTQGSQTVSWSKRIIDSSSNSVTIISQLPGQGNRRHYHSDWDEWWYILEGEWIYEIDGHDQRIHKGQLVFIERNKVHKVTATGQGRSARMAVSRADVGHIYQGGFDGSRSSDSE